MPWGARANEHWRRGQALAATAAGLAAWGAGNYTRSLMPSTSYGMRRGGRGYRRFAAKRRRRSYPLRRRFKGKAFRRRGVRFTNRKVKIYKPLHANFGVNDYRRLKFSVDVDSIELFTTYLPGPVVTRNLSLGDIAFGQSTTDAGDFTQFKLTNLQFVLEPLDKTNGDRHLELNVLDVPYIAIRFVSDSSLTNPTPNQIDLRQTPGYTYIPVARTRRTVLNTRPIIEKETALVGNATNFSHRTYINMPWMDIDFAANGTASFPVIKVEIFRPRVQAGSYTPQYDIRWYGDLLLRGRRVQLIGPDD